jgi:hypothetical protein
MVTTEEQAIEAAIQRLEAELAALKASLAECTDAAEATRLVRRRRDVEDDLSIRRQALAQLRATSEARAKAERERQEQERRQAVEAERSRRSAALAAKRQALANKLEELTADLAGLAAETYSYEVWVASEDRRPCRDLWSVVGDVAGSLLRDAGLMLTPVFSGRLEERIRHGGAK